MDRLRGIGAELEDLCETALSASLARAGDIASQVSQTDTLTDGITVPFAVTAGMAATKNNGSVVQAGLAELFAASISIGLGAYLAATTESKHYDVLQVRDTRLVQGKTKEAHEKLFEVFQRYGVGREDAKGAVAGLRANEHMAVQFSW